MKGDELTVQVPFMRVRRGLEVGFQKAEEGEGLSGPPLQIALWLARAHALELTLQECGPGTLRALSYRLGTTPQRLVLIHALIYLAPDLQEAVLFSMPEASRVNFENLVRIARMPLWRDQRKTWRHIVEAGPSKRESSPGEKPMSGNGESHLRAPTDPKKPRTGSKVAFQPFFQLS